MLKRVITTFRAIVSIGGVSAIVSTSQAQSSKDALPEGVGPDVVARGKALFEGPGLCTACHGQDGRGSAGPDLTDTLWLHHRGGYSDLVKQIIDGISQEQSKSGAPMPARGGSGLTDGEIRAIAAYVWTLSRRAKPDS